MSKVIDITEKLNFEENPKLKIKDAEIEVNTDATTVLTLMQTIICVVLLILASSLTLSATAV